MTWTHTLRWSNSERRYAGFLSWSRSHASLDVRCCPQAPFVELGFDSAPVLFVLASASTLLDESLILRSNSVCIPIVTLKKRLLF